jgi:hypothetical protein
MRVNRAPRTRFVVAVSIGVALGFVSYFQYGHHSLTHHNLYLSFVFGVGMTATWAAISTGPGSGKAGRPQ